jgi:DNA polymerase elongation subunit (family B)
MILDIENNDGQLIISYFDSEGKVQIKEYNMDECLNWVTCSAGDRRKSLDFTNWDGKSVKQSAEKRLNKFSIYEFIDNLPPAEKAEITALNFPKVQSVDIETEVIDAFPVPEIAREKITLIAIATEANATVVLGWKPLSIEQQKIIFDKHREYLKEFGDWNFKYICFEDEYNMLFTFITKFIPNFSLMIGWNFLGFDWKYIYNRAKRLGIDPSLASPTRKVQGKDNIPVHVGIIDYLDVYRRWDRTVAIKENNTLDFVGSAVLGVTKLKYEGTLQELYENDYDKYVLYNAIDAAIVCLIHKKLKTINAILSVSCLCNLSIYKASSAVNLTEALLWKGYYDRKQVIANRREDQIKGSYEGAYVKEPEIGIFRAATCFDYASLYPSVMRQCNISPESFIEKTTNQEKLDRYKSDPKYVVSVTGAVYDNTEVSVLKEILTNLYTKRKTFKNRHLDIERLLTKKKNN